jgi:Protein of unknown function DUF262
MKNFDTRVYSISDFLEWENNKLLNLSPDFQRRSVWPLKAKSYLVDTVLRGKPIPKILITQELEARRNVRVVVDGQQRLRAILEFVRGDFSISRAHNRDFAGHDFDMLPDQIKDDFYKYEIGVDLLYDTSYEDLLDIFARINTFTMKLNKQEILNARYLGFFKQNAFRLGYKFVNYFIEGRVLTRAQVSRMAEAELASDLLVVLCDGVQTNKSIEMFYRRFEDDPGSIEDNCREFEETMSYVGEIYTHQDLANTNWSRIHLFYSLFSSISHGLVGVRNLDPALRPRLSPASIGRTRVKLDEISARYDAYTSKNGEADAPPDYREFIERSRRGTTDTGARVFRSNFICGKLLEG